ncbi:MAG: hypothetical protein PF439_12895 [Helicobacteraceae bacterium]|nr:hypothetical protein [Helicobacteraceae bacterium]
MRAKHFYLPLVLAAVTLSADFDYTVTNTNFTVSQPSALAGVDETYLYNYDRLRLRGDYRQEGFFATFIGDGVNYLGEDYVTSYSFDYVREQKSDTAFKTETRFYDYERGMAYAKLYRLYGGYSDASNRVALGLQNITMGVGRIWTPTNLFNPRNTYALEPDETFGVAALSYTRYLDTTSQLTVVASQKADRSFKYAAIYKTFLEFADVGFDLVRSDETFMAGYELEANLADTGIEIRSEGAYITNNSVNVYHQDTNTTQKEDVAFFQGLVGADYGFENGVTVVFEALYSSKKFAYNEILPNIDSEILPTLVYSQFYMGTTLSYAFNLFLDGSLVYIESFNELNSRFVSPALTYTLNDYNTFTLGAMLQNGPSGSEFGMFGNSYYLRYSLSF